jgi:hypothetical protein
MAERKIYLGSIGPLTIDDEELLEETEESGWDDGEDADPTDDAAGEYQTALRASGILRRRRAGVNLDDEALASAILAGQGHNVIPLNYSTFENRKLPTLVSSNLTTTLETTISAFDTKSLKCVSTSAGGYVALTTGATVYNIRFLPNQKWLISAYVRSPAANTQIKFNIKLSDGTVIDSATITLASADTWYRKSAVIDATSYAFVKGHIRITIIDNAKTLYVDAIMAEIYLGDGSDTTPSAYIYGTQSYESLMTDGVEPDAIIGKYVDSAASNNLVSNGVLYTIGGDSSDFALMSGDCISLGVKVEDCEGKIMLALSYSDDGGSYWTSCGAIVIAANYGGYCVAQQSITSDVTRRYRATGFSYVLDNNLLQGVAFNVFVYRK